MALVRTMDMELVTIFHVRVVQTNKQVSKHIRHTERLVTLSLWALRSDRNTPVGRNNIKRRLSQLDTADSSKDTIVQDFKQ
jgi:hypothetical protein